MNKKPINEGESDELSLNSEKKDKRGKIKELLIIGKSLKKMINTSI